MTKKMDWLKMYDNRRAKLMYGYLYDDLYLYLTLHAGNFGGFLTI